MKCEIFLFDGAEELDALAPYEVFQSARSFGACIETSLVAHDGNRPIRLAHGAMLIPHARPSTPDILVIPGGGWIGGASVGARAEAENPRTLTLLREVHEAGALIAGVCTGTMLMARAGLLKGRPAVTHHSALDDLCAEGVVVTRARVVDDGDIVTCGGVTSGLDLALWLVERFFGAEMGSKTAAYLEYERRGDVSHGRE